MLLAHNNVTLKQLDMFIFIVHTIHVVGQDIEWMMTVNFKVKL